MTTKKVLISGAGVAGPALAYWLNRDGYEVSVVERAPSLRDSGYAVDVRGAAFDLLDEMGILGEATKYETHMRGITLLDETGAETGHLPAEVFAGDLELSKRDLTRILHQHTAADVEYVFDDSISSLTQHESSVQIEFEHGAPREFDLVIGADGVYSKVRQLALCPHADALRHLGMSGVGFTTTNYLGLDHSGLLLPGKGTAIYVFSGGDPNQLTVSLSYATESGGLDQCGRDEQERAVRTAFAGHGWEAPRLLDAMAQALDFYFASTWQVELDHWAHGRVALVGDAGYCAAPTSGMGTSQALIGARVLARHLASSGRDHQAGFAAYERELRPYVTQNQATGREAAKMFGAAA